MNYPFTENEAATAYETWGANCGPNALAFALQITLDHAMEPGTPQMSGGYTPPPTAAAIEAARIAQGRGDKPS